ncbi:MAG: lysophospholipase L1-like esterase [Myxococcota bacterium]|jgi:lysophospholipase L1-like esterase
MLHMVAILGLGWSWAATRNVVLQIDGASTGVPTQSCREALSEGLDWTSVRQPLSTQPTLAVPELPEVRFSSRSQQGKPSSDASAGSPFDPTTLPLQPFEGRAEDIWRVGEVMRRAAAGERVRMTFFGASHTGGDWWTGHIRRALQSRYGDGGHGFILPAALYRGYRGSDINLCSSAGWQPDYVAAPGSADDGLLGLGMSVTGSDSEDFGWIETTETNPHGREADRYRIFALGHPDGGGLHVQLDGLPKQSFSTIDETVGLVHAQVEVPRGGHRLLLTPDGDGPTRLLGVSVERTGPGVVVDAIGVRGRQARHMLRWEPALATEMLSALAPDLIVLAYGTNEAADSDYEMDAYADDLRAALRQVRAGAPHAACILVGPSDRGIKSRSRSGPPTTYTRTAPVAQVQREVAPELGCVFWDWQQATGGPGSMISWRDSEPPLAAGDLIHFTPAGYVHSAARFLDALDAAADTPLKLLGSPQP